MKICGIIIDSVGTVSPIFLDGTGDAECTNGFIYMDSMNGIQYFTALDGISIRGCEISEAGPMMEELIGLISEPFNGVRATMIIAGDFIVKKTVDGIEETYTTTSGYVFTDMNTPVGIFGIDDITGVPLHLSDEYIITGDYDEGNYEEVLSYFEVLSM